VSYESIVYEVDFLHVVIAREDVEAGNTSRYAELLSGLLESADRLRRFRERVLAAAREARISRVCDRR